MAELFGALLITFFLTRAIYIGLSIAKKRINPIKAALIAFFLVAAIALLVSSFTMGIGKGFILYIPCLVLWLIIDIVRAKKNPESKNKQEVNMPKEEKFCMNCGAKIPADAKICPVCGTKQPSLDVRPKEDTLVEKSYEGIGGWLILPTFGLFIASIRAIALMFTDFASFFAKGYWNVLTTPGSEAYHPLLSLLIIFESVGVIIFIIFPIVLLVFLFRKSRLFPNLMVSYLVLNLLFVVISDLPAIAEQNNSGSVEELATAAISAAIWIPYFLVSKRVKQTFVK